LEPASDNLILETVQAARRSGRSSFRIGDKTGTCMLAVVTCDDEQTEKKLYARSSVDLVTAVRLVDFNDSHLEANRFDAVYDFSLTLILLGSILRFSEHSEGSAVTLTKITVNSSTLQ
jgi:hypothetical protein